MGWAVPQSFTSARRASLLTRPKLTCQPLGETPSYLDYVQTDDTPESYFQLAVLSMMGSQFYLYWHANYNDSQIICDKVDVTDIVSSLDGDFGYPISLISRIRAPLLEECWACCQYRRVKQSRSGL